MQQELPHGACRCAETDEHHRKAADKRERGSKEAVARMLARAKLLDSNSRKHRNIAWYQWQNTRGEKRNQPCNEGVDDRNLHQLDKLRRNNPSSLPYLHPIGRLGG